MVYMLDDKIKKDDYSLFKSKGKTKKINYKLKKTVKNNPNDYIIVNNTHEAIINRDKFNYVQAI